MYVCMYVCAYDSRWDSMHMQHISLLSCITSYIALGGDVRSLLQEERTGRGMAIIGCIVEGRPSILQKQRDRETKGEREARSETHRRDTQTHR